MFKYLVIGGAVALWIAYEYHQRHQRELAILWAEVNALKYGDIIKEFSDALED